VLLGLFTVCEAYMVAGITIPYPPKIVAMAGLVTALVKISLTIYAFRTKTNIKVFCALIFVVYIAMMPILVLSLFMFPGKYLYTLNNVLGVLFYSLFLIIDTMMICDKGQGLSGERMAIELDDYVIGALLLYMDIIMLFIYIFLSYLEIRMIEGQ
jgi:FtsH-binding integral membrane protein